MPPTQYNMFYSSICLRNGAVSIGEKHGELSVEKIPLISSCPHVGWFSNATCLTPIAAGQYIYYGYRYDVIRKPWLCKSIYTIMVEMECANALLLDSLYSLLRHSSKLHNSMEFAHCSATKTNTKTRNNPEPKFHSGQNK